MKIVWNPCHSPILLFSYWLKLQSLFTVCIESINWFIWNGNDLNMQKWKNSQNILPQNFWLVACTISHSWNSQSDNSNRFQYWPNHLSIRPSRHFPQLSIFHTATDIIAVKIERRGGAFQPTYYIGINNLWESIINQFFFH